MLVQDDASPDYDSRRFLPLPFKVERNETNLGFIGNVNRAAQRAKGDYLCLLNQDCFATHGGWADIMLTLITSNPAIGIVGPKLIFPETGAIQSCGGLFDAGRGPYHRYLGWQNNQDRRVNTTEKVSWITGACLMISRADFEKLGGLDERYIRAYFEDVSLCCQMRYELGKEIFYCADAILEHSGGSSGDTQNFRRNSITFHAKWDSYIVPDSDRTYVDY